MPGKRPARDARHHGIRNGEMVLAYMWPMFEGPNTAMPTLIDGVGRASRAFREQGDSLVAHRTMPLAAVAHQKSNEVRQPGEHHAVDDRPAFTSAFEQARLFELTEVERDARGRRTAKRLGYRASGETIRTRDDKHPHDPEPGLIGNRGKCTECLIFVHLSLNSSTLFEV